MEMVRVRVPVLARLILSDLAERRGEPEETILARLIHREAVTELGKQIGMQELPDRAGEPHAIR